MGVPPNHPFIERILGYKPSSYWGTTMYGHPHIISKHGTNPDSYHALPGREGQVHRCHRQCLESGGGKREGADSG